MAQNFEPAGTTPYSKDRFPSFTSQIKYSDFLWMSEKIKNLVHSIVSKIKPVVVTSGYRDTTHPYYSKGSAHSYHSAMDIRMEGYTDQEKIDLILACYNNPEIMELGISKSHLHLGIGGDAYYWVRQTKFVYFYGRPGYVKQDDGNKKKETHEFSGWFADSRDLFLVKLRKAGLPVKMENSSWHGEVPKKSVISPEDIAELSKKYKDIKQPAIGKEETILASDSIPSDIRQNIIKAGLTIIGNKSLYVPPQMIAMNQRVANLAYPTLRTEGNPKILGQVSPFEIHMSLTFTGVNSLNNELRHILAMFKRTPFVPLHNAFVAAVVKPEIRRLLHINSFDVAKKESKDLLANTLTDIKNPKISKEVLTLEDIRVPVTLNGVSVSSVPGLVDTFQCQISFGVFNHIPFSKNFSFVKTTEDARNQALYLRELTDPSISIDDIKERDYYKKIPIVPTNYAFNSEPFKEAYSTALEESRNTHAGRVAPNLMEKYIPEAQKSLYFSYKYTDQRFFDIMQLHLSKIRREIEAFTAAKQLADLGELLKQPKNLFRTFISEINSYLLKVKNYGKNQRKRLYSELSRIHNIQGGQEDSALSAMLKGLNLDKALGNYPLIYDDNQQLVKRVDEWIEEYMGKNGKLDTQRKKEFKEALETFIKATIKTVMEIYAGNSSETIAVKTNTLKIGGDSKTVITGIGAEYINKMVPINIISHTIPTYQHMGTGDWSVNMNLRTTDEAFVSDIRKMMVLIETTKTIGSLKSAELFKHMDSSIFLAPERLGDTDYNRGHFLRFLGIHKMLIRDLSISTVEGKPGLYEMSMSFVQNDIPIGEYEALGGTKSIPAFMVDKTKEVIQEASAYKLILSNPIRLSEEKANEVSFKLKALGQDEFSRYVKAVWAAPHEWEISEEQGLFGLSRFFKNHIDPLGTLFTFTGWNDLIDEHLEDVDNLYEQEKEKVQVRQRRRDTINAINDVQYDGTHYSSFGSTAYTEPLTAKALELAQTITSFLGSRKLEGDIVNLLENKARRNEILDRISILKLYWKKIQEMRYGAAGCYPDLHLPNLIEDTSNLGTPPDFYLAVNELIDENVISIGMQRMENQLDMMAMSAVALGKQSWHEYEIMKNTLTTLSTDIEKFWNKNKYGDITNELGVTGAADYLRKMSKIGVALLETDPALYEEGNKELQKVTRNVKNLIITKKLTSGLKGLIYSGILNMESRQFKQLQTYVASPEAKQGLTEVASATRELTNAKKYDLMRLRGDDFRGKLDFMELIGMNNTNKKGIGDKKNVIEARKHINSIQGQALRGVLDEYFSNALDLAQVLNLEETAEDESYIWDNIIQYYGLSSPETEVAKATQLFRVLQTKKNDRTLRMSRAFPTYKLYFIDEDKEEWILYDDFYTWSAIKSISVIDSKDSPSKVAVVELSNITGSLTNVKRAAKVQSDIDGDEPLYQVEQAGIDSMMLRPGCSIMIKLGYENDPMSLTTVFQGKVTEVNPGEAVEMIAQGFGAELTNVVGDASGLNVNWNDTAKGHGDVVRYILDETPGLEHFGKKEITYLLNNEKAQEKGFYSDIRAPGYVRWQGRWLRFFLPSQFEGIANFIEADTPLDSNIYLQFTNNQNPFWWMTFDWRVYPNTSAWDAIQEMLLLYPNYICRVLPYNANYQPLCNDIRVTLYIGPKDGFYKFTDNPYSPATLRDWPEQKDESEYTKNFINENKEGVVEFYFKSMFQDLSIDGKQFRYFKEFGKKNGQYRGFMNFFGKLAEVYEMDTRLLQRKGYRWVVDLYYGRTRSIGLVNELRYDPDGDGIRRSVELTLNDEQFEALQNGVKADLENSDRFALTLQTSKNTDFDVAKGYFIKNPWYKPVTDFHIVDSVHHIISNNIIASADNMSNRVILGFTDEPPTSADGSADLDDIRSFEAVASPSIFPDVIRTYQAFHPNLDTNWFDDLGSFKMVNRKNIDDWEKDDGFDGETSKLTWYHFPAYVRTANTILANQLRGMYTGDLIIVGNPEIKAWDKIYLNDLVSDVHGVFEVAKVIHRLDSQSGFTTTIVPMLNVSMRDVRDMLDTSYISKVFDIAEHKRFLTALGTTGAGVLTGATLSGVAGTVAAKIGVTTLTGLSLGIALPAVAAIATFGAVRGYAKYGDFVIDRIGRMLGTEPITISPLTYRGRPYTAGLEGYRHGNMTAHISHMLDNMTIAERIGHPFGYDSVIKNMGENKSPGEQLIDGVTEYIFSTQFPKDVGSTIYDGAKKIVN